MQMKIDIGLAGRPAESKAMPAAKFSRSRFALLTFLGVYPLITSLLYAVLPVTEGWQIWQRSLVITPIMVVAMVWGVTPLIQRKFWGFLNPAK